MQTDFFAEPVPDSRFAELCNALYERELSYIADHPPSNASLLQRRLKGLSYNIRNAAGHMLTQQSPMDLDLHNASWQSKQTTQSPHRKHKADQTVTWLSKYAQPGLPVPVFVENLGRQHIELDSVDKVSLQHNKVRLNKNGWFCLDGTPVSGVNRALRLTEQIDRLLLKPNQAAMVAACGGHCWDSKGKTGIRTLTLRELLLSCSINWTNLNKPKPVSAG